MSIPTGAGADPAVTARTRPSPGPPRTGRPAPSVLFESSRAGAPLHPAELTALSDTQLDQVKRRMTKGHEEFGIDAYFQVALRTPAAVAYRHAVLTELEDSGLRAAIRRFTDEIAAVQALRRAGASDNRPTRHDARLLAAANRYCAAVRRVRSDLVGCGSEGLQRIRAYLDGYITSAAFTVLEAEAADIDQVIAGLRYRLEIDGNRVSVSPPQPGHDYSAEVAAAFSRFPAPETGQPVPAAAAFSTDDLSDVEAQVLDAVSKLFPEAFARRTRFSANHRDFQDPTVMRFAREVRFYIAYLELIAPLRAAGLPFCLPRVDLDPDTIDVLDGYDLAVANKRFDEGGDVVSNDFRLTRPERIIVVTGPNNGGKTTFARTVAQLHHLARLGLYVPARSARLGVADRVLSHFEREEDVATLQGKFDEELLRARELLTLATRRSVIILNESFNSTSLTDARFVGTEVLERISELGCLAVYVTFVDELAELGPTTVSMVAQVAPEDPAQRTLQILRQAPTGLAHTWALAEKYGLSYDQLTARIDP